jgi:hypothetical protein
MKASKIVLAIVITLALLVVARRASQRQVPLVTETTTYGELTLSHTCKHIDKGDLTPADLDLLITGGLLPEGTSVMLYYYPRSPKGDYTGVTPVHVEAVTIPGHDLIYRVSVPNQGRGTEFTYWFQLESDDGKLLATVPSDLSQNTPSRFWFRFEGKRSVPLLVGHIAFMFGSFLLMVIVFLTAIEDTKLDAVRARLGKQTLWAVIVLFIGSFPLGIWLEHQVYGTYWTGIPFGTDKTDTKTLLIFVYWLVMLLLLKGSAFRSDPKGDTLGPTAARWVAIIGVLLSLAMYLIPHSSGSF